MSLTELVAYELCKAELRNTLGYDRYLEEVVRTWRRFIPEADSLVKNLQANGVVLTTSI